MTVSKARTAALLLALVTLGTASGLMAQQYVVSKLPTQAQLPVANIHCILQDSEGYMWYGTNGGGICRDNGYQTDVWRDDATHPRRINSNDVTCMAEDRQHRIWFGTRLGLYCIDKADYSLSQPVGRYAETPVDALYADADGRIWVSSRSETACCSSSGKILSVSKSPYPVSQFYAVGSSLWAAYWGGGMAVLSARDYRSGRSKFQKKPWNAAAFPVCMAKAHEQDGLWIGTWGQGIGYYDTVSGRFTPQPATLGAAGKRQIIDICIDRSQGLLWATTMDNLYAYTIKGKTLAPMPLETLLPQGSKILDHMTEDRNGNIYVAGFTPHTFIISTDNNQIKCHTVPAMTALTGFPLLADRVVADGKGFWIWQGRVGLTHYMPSTGRVTPVKTQPFERSIVQKKGGDGIWAASGNRLFSLTATENGIHETVAATVKENISSLSEQGNGHLWIGTDRAIYCHSTLGGQTELVSKTEGKVIRTAVTDNRTVYAVIAGKGLWEYGGKGRQRRIDNGGEEFSALAILYGNTLIASTVRGNIYTLNEGDNRMERDSWMSLANGDMIKDVKTDGMGHVWTLADQYVTEHNPQNHAFRVFRNTDPFINVSYFYSLEPTANGMMLNGAGAFCMANSSAALNHSNVQGAKPVVSAVATADSTILIGRDRMSLRLPSGQQAVAIRLSTLDVLHANEISYAYRLGGKDSEWVYLPQGTNTITIADLPKGLSRLEAKATDTNGCWGAERLCLEIYRAPFWYETWWFRLLCALLAVGIGVGLWRLNRSIHWLETLQRKRKELSLSEISLLPEDTNKAKLDEQFLRQAINSVEKHLDDTDFSVEVFAGELCMSRMNLYRKIQGQTGLTPSEFIRDIRLKKAAQLIANGPKMPVTEIAGRVGFSSSGYFSKCFRNKFGVLPSEYTGAAPS